MADAGDPGPGDSTPDPTAQDSTAQDSTAQGASVLAREAAERAEVSQAALGRYATRLRRQRLIYFPVVTAVIAALIITFVIAYLHGEAHNTRLITVAKGPATLDTTTPSADQTMQWRTGDRAAIGQPLVGGTVVVYGGRTMRGIDARTGKQTWSYYRSDRTICTAAQMDGIAVAVYELSGNCDEVTALDANTGAREWTRTLDFNGRPIFGVPTFQADVSDDMLMMTTPAAIYAVTVDSGEDGGQGGFVYNHFGCRINGAVLGSSGALISQTCTKPQCATLIHCGKGPQLLLRGDIFDNVNSDSTTNPNRITWNDIGNTDVPVSAGDAITAGSTTTGRLDVYGSQKGALSGSVDVGATGSDWRTAQAIPLTDDVLVSVGDRLSYVRGTSAVWTIASSGLPSVTVDGRTVVALGADGARLLDGLTGRQRQNYPLTPQPPTDGSVSRLGDGFLVTSSSGTVAYG